MAPRGYSSIAVKVSLTEEVLDISSTNRISVLLKSKRLMTLFMGILSEIKLPPNEAIAHLSEVDDSQECVVFESGLVGCTEGSSIPAPSTDTPKAVVQIAGGDGVESRGVSLLTDGSVVCGGIHLCGFDYPDSHVEWYGLPTSYGTGPTMPSVPKSRYVSLGCLVGDDGKVYCWGPNGYGELGTGARDWFDGVWRPALNISNAVKVMARDNFHRCALTGDGSLWCWGANHVGQVGNGKIVEGECDPDPRDVTEVQYHCPGVYAPEKVMDDVVDFALGNSHTCAVKKNGDVYCWGSQRVGALGNGVNID